MAHSSSDQPLDVNPTPAEIFRVFRNTTMASIEGLRLLLEECADLRGELLTMQGLQSNGDGEGTFPARQRKRILQLQEAAQDMEALLVSLPGGAADAGHEA